MTQWEALIKTSSCVFTETTFGLKVQTLLGLAGYAETTIQRWYSPGDPRDLGDAILALGRVTRGQMDSITVSGGPVCCWLATYAEFLLGLRVEVNLDAVVLMRTHDARIADAQLRVNLVHDEHRSKALDQVARGFVVRDGNDFIDQVFSSYGDNVNQEAYFLGGALSWDTIFIDTFGQDGAELLGQLSAEAFNEDQSHDAFITPFRELYMLGLDAYFSHAVEAGRLHNIESYVYAVVDKLSELRPLETQLRSRSSEKLNDVELTARYNIISRKLRAICGCDKCVGELGNPNNNRIFCLHSITETILLLSYLLARCELKSQLRPKRLGVLLLYQDLNDRTRKESIGGVKQALHHPNIETLTSHLTLGSFGSNTSFIFNAYTTLFQGVRGQILLSPNYPSAHSNGAVYCFVGSLSGLSMDYAESSKVCIGSGVIEHRSRVRNWVFDNKGSVDTVERAYPVQELTFAQDLTVLDTDTSSPGLSIEAVVEDAFQLVFYYRIVSPIGRRSIPPALFVSRCLLPITSLRVDCYLSPSTLPRSRWESDLKASTHGLARGEGNAPVPPSGLVLRPHKGNLLGQCVALSWNPQKSVFVTSESQLDAFLGRYAQEAVKVIGRGESPPPYFVISG